jgi:hypothetical protein
MLGMTIESAAEAGYVQNDVQTSFGEQPSRIYLESFRFAY